MRYVCCCSFDLPCKLDFLCLSSSAFTSCVQLINCACGLFWLFSVGIEPGLGEGICFCQENISILDLVVSIMDWVLLLFLESHVKT